MNRGPSGGGRAELGATVGYTEGQAIRSKRERIARSQQKLAERAGRKGKLKVHRMEIVARYGGSEHGQQMASHVENTRAFRSCQRSDVQQIGIDTARG